MSNSDSSLISAVRRGELDFERLVEVLSKAGHLTDIDGKQGLGFTRTRIEGARQEDFDALFQFFYPCESHSIKLRSCATDKGFLQRGAYTYALFNENIVSREEMMVMLVRLNAQQERDFPSMG
jgi:hypothetical protein